MNDHPAQNNPDDHAGEDTGRDAVLTRRLRALAEVATPVEALLDGLPRRAARILRRRRIILGAVLGVIAMSAIVASALVQRADRPPPTPTATTPPAATTSVPSVPPTLPGGVSLAPLAAGTLAGAQDWDATLPNGDVRFSCIYRFGIAQYLVTGGVVHLVSSGASLRGWYVTPSDNESVFTDGTNEVHVSAAARPDETGSRCRLTVTAMGLRPTTTITVPSGPVSLDPLPSGANGAIPDKDLGDGNVAFTCNYQFGWAYFGANATLMAFLSATPAAGWHLGIEPYTDTNTDPLHRTASFSNGVETVVVIGTAVPDASGSRCHAQRLGPDHIVSAPGT